MRSKARSPLTPASHESPGGKSNGAAATARAESRLRDASVRVTDARVKVLAALIEASSASSHQDMQELFVDMDRVTLYRALDCLTEAGLAHKIAGDDRVFRYSSGTEQSGEHEHGTHLHGAGHQHGHFKCTRCARVFCLDGNVLWPAAGTTADTTPGSAKPREGGMAAAAGMRQRLQAAVLENLGKGFKAFDMELTVKGWCADCAH